MSDALSWGLARRVAAPLVVLASLVLGLSPSDLVGSAASVVSSATDVPPDLLESVVPHDTATDVRTTPTAGTPEAVSRVENPQRGTRVTVTVTDVFAGDDGTTTAAGRMRVEATRPDVTVAPPDVVATVNGGRGDTRTATVAELANGDWSWRAELSDVVVGDRLTATASEGEVVEPVPTAPPTAPPTESPTEAPTGSPTAPATPPGAPVPPDAGTPGTPVTSGPLGWLATTGASPGLLVLLGAAALAVGVLLTRAARGRRRSPGR